MPKDQDYVEARFRLHRLQWFRAHRYARDNGLTFADALASLVRYGLNFQRVTCDPLQLLGIVDEEKT